MRSQNWQGIMGWYLIWSIWNQCSFIINFNKQIDFNNIWHEHLCTSYSFSQQVYYCHVYFAWKFDAILQGFSSLYNRVRKTDPDSFPNAEHFSPKKPQTHENKFELVKIVLGTYFRYQKFNYSLWHFLNAIYFLQIGQKTTHFFPNWHGRGRIPNGLRKNPVYFTKTLHCK